MTIYELHVWHQGIGTKVYLAEDKEVFKAGLKESDVIVLSRTMYVQMAGDTDGQTATS